MHWWGFKGGIGLVGGHQFFSEKTFLVVLKFLNTGLTVMGSPGGSITGLVR